MLLHFVRQQPQLESLRLDANRMVHALGKLMDAVAQHPGLLTFSAQDNLMAGTAGATLCTHKHTGHTHWHTHATHTHTHTTHTRTHAFE